MRAGLHQHLVPALQFRLHLPIHRQHSRPPTGDDDMHRHPLGQDNGPLHAQVWRDRDEQDVAQLRRQNRPPGRQRVGGAPCRRGDDEAIGNVGSEVAPVNLGAQVHHAGPRPPPYHHVVQCLGLPQRFATPPGRYAKDHPLLDPAVARQHPRQDLPPRLRLGLGEEPHPPQVDPQEQCAVGSRSPHRTQDRTVAAQRHQQAGFLQAECIRRVVCRANLCLPSTLLYPRGYFLRQGICPGNARIVEYAYRLHINR